MSTSCKQLFPFREKGKEEELICGTDELLQTFLSLNFLYFPEELHLNSTTSSLRWKRWKCLRVILGPQDSTGERYFLMFILGALEQ